MAQHDYDVANGSGAAVRADLNDLFDAIATLNSGPSAPGTTFAYQWWFDTTNDLLKIRDGLNAAWVIAAKLSGTTWTPYFEGTELDVVSEAEAEAGAATIARVWTAERVAQAIAALASGGGVTAGTPLIQDPLAGSASITQAHGLGAEPNVPFDVVLECIATADLGYSAGDRVRSTQYNVWSIWADATNTYLETASGTMQVGVIRKDTNAFGFITNSSWKLEVTPFLRS